MAGDPAGQFAQLGWQSWSSRALLCLAIAAAGTLSGGGSSEARVIARGPDILNAPVLAGDRVFLHVYAGGRRQGVDSLAVGGGPRRRVVTAMPPPRKPGRYPGFTMSVTASPDTLAFSRYAEHQDPRNPSKTAGPVVLRREVFAGPVAGPLRGILDCRPTADELIVSPPAAAAGDGFVATIGEGCERNLVSILDPQTGAVLQRAPRGLQEVDEVAAAGDKVAWVSNRYRGSTTLSVYDVTAGRMLFQAAVPGDATGLDVQGDGTAVILGRSTTRPGSGYGCGLTKTPTWYSPAEPYAHDLPVKACLNSPRIAAGRIALMRPRGSTDRRDLVLVDLAGRAQPVAAFNSTFGRMAEYLTSLRYRCVPVPEVHLLSDCSELARLTDRFFGHGDFDWDGTHVAWREVNCVDNVVSAVKVAELGASRPAARCPVRVGRRLTVGRRGRTITVPLRCPRGCTGMLGIQNPTRLQPFDLGRHAVGDRQVPSFAIGRSRGRGSVRIVLDPDQARLIHRRRRTRIKLIVAGLTTKNVTRTVTVR